jgi:ABC-type phosphate transport system substrate-binding protein
MKLRTIHRRRLVAVVLAASVTLGLAACATSSAAGSNSTNGTVYFGVSAAITGQYAQYGQQFKEGFDLAVQQVNASGGIKGHLWPLSTRTRSPIPNSRWRSRRCSSATLA